MRSDVGHFAHVFALALTCACVDVRARQSESPHAPHDALLRIQALPLRR